MLKAFLRKGTSFLLLLLLISASFYPAMGMSTEDANTVKKMKNLDLTKSADVDKALLDIKGAIESYKNAKGRKAAEILSKELKPKLKKLKNELKGLNEELGNILDEIDELVDELCNMDLRIQELNSAKKALQQSRNTFQAEYNKFKSKAGKIRIQ
ncbi:hypothetical protein DRP07_12050, partial [Archaeoglobales archaeon]